MQFIETLWLNALNLVEEGIVRRAYLNGFPRSIVVLAAPVLLIVILSVVSRTVVRLLRYVAFTVVSGAAFYFLLRTL